MGQKEGEIWTWKQFGRTDSNSKRLRIINFFWDRSKIDLEGFYALWAKEAFYPMVSLLDFQYPSNIGHILSRLPVCLNAWLTSRHGFIIFHFALSITNFFKEDPLCSRNAQSIEILGQLKFIFDVSNAVRGRTATFCCFCLCFFGLGGDV